MHMGRGALAMIAITALVVAGCSSGGRGGPKSPADGHDPNLTAAATDSLFKGLTDDLARRDSRAFLARFTGSAKGSATRWWQNMSALGFAKGVFYPRGRPRASPGSWSRSIASTPTRASRR